MAKPSWVTLNKTSGTGNSTFTASSKAYTGRVKRTGSILVKSTKDASKTATVSVTQSAAAESIKAVSSSIQVPASDPDGYPIEARFEITCNSKYFCLKLGANTPQCNVAFTPAGGASSTALTGTDVSAGGFKYYTIPDDAGATAAYTIRLIFTIPNNETISSIARTLVAAGVSASIPTTMPTTNKLDLTITQAAKVVKLSVSPTAITIPAAGTAQTVTVTSNDAWTVS